MNNEHSFTHTQEELEQLRTKLWKEYNDYMDGKRCGKYNWCKQIEDIYFPYDSRKTNVYADEKDMIQLVATKLNQWIDDSWRRHSKWYWCEYTRAYINSYVKSNRNKAQSVPDIRDEDERANGADVFEVFCNAVLTPQERYAKGLYDSVYGDDDEVKEMELKVKQYQAYHDDFESKMSKCIDRSCQRNKKRVMNAIVNYGLRLGNLEESADKYHVSKDTLRKVLQDAYSRGLTKQKLFRSMDLFEDLAVMKIKVEEMR